MDKLSKDELLDHLLRTLPKKELERLEESAAKRQSQSQTVDAGSSIPKQDKGKEKAEAKSVVPQPSDSFVSNQTNADNTPIDQSRVASARQTEIQPDSMTDSKIDSNSETVTKTEFRTLERAVETMCNKLDDYMEASGVTRRLNFPNGANGNGAQNNAQGPQNSQVNVVDGGIPPAQPRPNVQINNANPPVVGIAGANNAVPQQQSVILANFATSNGSIPYDRLPVEEQRIVQSNRKSAQEFLKGLSPPGSLNYFNEQCTTPEEVVKNLDFLLEMEDEYKRYLNMFPQSDTYFPEKHFIQYYVKMLQKKVSQDSLFASFNNFLSKEFSTFTSFANFKDSFKVNFIPSHLDQVFDKIIEDIPLTLDGVTLNMQSYQNRLDRMLRLFEYYTEEKYPEFKLPGVLKKAIFKFDEELHVRMMHTIRLTRPTFDSMINFLERESTVRTHGEIYKSEQQMSGMQTSSARPPRRTPLKSRYFHADTETTQPYTFNNDGQVNLSYQTPVNTSALSLDSNFMSLTSEDAVERDLWFSLDSSIECDMCGEHQDAHGKCQCTEPLTDTVSDFDVADKQDALEELYIISSEKRIPQDFRLCELTDSSNSTLMLVQDRDGKIISSDKFKCKHCGDNHFVRDCPKLGGSGKSKLGAKWGSARGFKQGDDPNLRPKSYRDARARNIRRRRAILSKISKKTHTDTYAKQQRRKQAKNPSEHHYQYQASDFNVLYEDLLSQDNSQTSSLQ